MVLVILSNYNKTETSISVREHHFLFIVMIQKYPKAFFFCRKWETTWLPHEI